VFATFVLLTSNALNAASIFNYRLVNGSKQDFWEPPSAFTFCHLAGLRYVTLIVVGAVLNLGGGSLLTVFGLPVFRPKLAR